MRYRGISVGLAALAALAAGWWQSLSPGGEPPLPGASLGARSAAQPTPPNEAPGRLAAAVLPSPLVGSLPTPKAVGVFASEGTDPPPAIGRRFAVVVAYFYDSESGRYAPVALRLGREMPLAEATTAAFNALCSGPPAEAREAGYVTALPPDCRVARARVSGQTLRLEVNPAFLQVPAARAQRWAKQVSHTAAQFPGLRQVELVVSGRTVGVGPGGIRLPLPVGRPPKQ